jgi:hypothetical protein
MKRWFFIALLAFGLWRWWHDRPVHQPPGVLVAGIPVQQHIAGNVPQFEKNGYAVKALASFSMTARTLGVEHYSFDRESNLAPVDIAFGWGPMSDSNVLAKIRISQGGRFYNWHVDEFPVSRRDIEVNSANMHLIPANADVERNLERVRVGAIVNLSGYLVEARAPDGWHWRSSLTREDTGAGACELIWVERFEQVKTN